MQRGDGVDGFFVSRITFHQDEAGAVRRDSHWHGKMGQRRPAGTRLIGMDAEWEDAVEGVVGNNFKVRHQTQIAKVSTAPRREGSAAGMGPPLYVCLPLGKNRHIQSQKPALHRCRPGRLDGRAGRALRRRQRRRQEDGRSWRQHRLRHALENKPPAPANGHGPLGLHFELDRRDRTCGRGCGRQILSREAGAPCQGREGEDTASCDGVGGFHIFSSVCSQAAVIFWHHLAVCLGLLSMLSLQQRARTWPTSQIQPPRSGYRLDAVKPRRVARRTLFCRLGSLNFAVSDLAQKPFGWSQRVM